MSTTERLRLFVALDLPAEARAAIAEWGERALRGAGGIRRVAPENLHVTLCFLGDRPAADVAGIAAVCRSAVVAGPGTAIALSLGEVVWLGGRRPRVVAVTLVDAGGEGKASLAGLQAAVAGGLVCGGYVAPERRPFRPHVTVGRVRGSADRTRGADGEPAPLGPLRFIAPSMTLYRSRTSPDGARYEALATIELSPSHR